MKKILFALLCCWSIIAPSAMAATLKLPYLYNQEESQEESYELGLLKLALSYTHEPYNFSFAAEEQNDETRVAAIEQGALDLFWAATNSDLERRLAPIRIPLYKGLLGHRLLVIRQQDAPRFASIRTLGELANLKAGQGRFWTDTRILKKSGLNVVTAVKTASLYPMLDGGRFDYYPRGAGEAWHEVEEQHGFQVMVEPHLLLIYKMPLYFFVSQQNPQLAQRIEQGLEQAIADGSFDRYFYAHPNIKSVLERSNLRQRIALHLDNPDLPAATPLQRPELWFDYTREVTE